jgi:hypothetical protein
MGSILNFVSLFEENNRPEWVIFGPFTDYIQRNYEYTVGIDIDNTLNNIIVIETVEHFKGCYRNLKTEFLGTTLFDILKNNDVKIIFASLADPAPQNSKDKLRDEIAKLNLTDKVYYIDSVMNHKDDKNTFCYHHFLEEPCVYKQEFGHFDFFTQNDLGYKSEDMLENELDVFRNNKFLSFNRTIDKEHRFGLYHTYLTNDFSDSYFSFLKLWDDFGRFYTSTPKLTFEEYRSHLPIELDTKGQDVDLTSFKTSNTFSKSLFLDSCIHIVTETSYHCNGVFISEKIIKPILCYQPFIVLGPYQYLKELKRLGFKTFSEFWDESYDEIENPKERYFAIEKIILELNNKTINEFNEIYQKIKNICIYNRKVFDNYKVNSIPDIIKQIENEK